MFDLILFPTTFSCWRCGFMTFLGKEEKRPVHCPACGEFIKKTPKDQEEPERPK